MISKTQLFVFYILLSFTTFCQTEIRKSIYFENNSSTLNQGSLFSIDSIFNLCDNKSQYSIKISGHTDSIGSLEYNSALSEKRVLSVINYLKSKNYDTNNIKTESFGETKPIVLNDLESNRAKNRRVEIILVIQKTEEKKDELEERKEIWPGSNAILVKYGSHEYELPGKNEGKIEIEVYSTTNEMEAGNFSTYTVDGQVLTSNLVFCIRPVNRKQCVLDEPIKVFLPANNGGYCMVADVELFDAVNDTVNNSPTTWDEVEPLYETEVKDGQVYFVFTIKDVCDRPCKNLDCRKSPELVKSINIHSKGFRKKLNRVDVIHQDARAILPGKEIAKNKWKAEMLIIPTIQTPIIKLTMKRGKKESIKRIQLNTIKQDKKGNYIIKRKQLK